MGIHMLHPAWVFAGHGPCILPVSLPALTSAIMAPHAAEMIQNAVPSTPQVLTDASSPSPQVIAEQPVEDEQQDDPVQEVPKDVPVQKATLSVKLTAFETAKKI